MDNARTLIQRTHFAPSSPPVVTAMYVKADDADIRNSRTEITVARGATASLNTYFGRFAASYWQRYTALNTVVLSFAYECAEGGELLLQVNASDAGGRGRPIREVRLTGCGTHEVELAVDRFVDGGGLWFDITAHSAAVTVGGVQWFATQPPRVERNASVVICTHNRPADCVVTAGALSSDSYVTSQIDAVYVVDQGTEQVKGEAGFSDLVARLGSKLHYITQPNLGGAGGFTRGMYELTASGECDTNIIVMDDDILCDPESIFRINSFANFTTRPMLVGAQMLLLSETYRVHITGEWEDVGTIEGGRLSPGGKAGLNALIKHQDLRVDAGWNGWWSCLLPPEAVLQLGYSMPMFFQWDDIEYGIRARRAGFPTVTLPNAGVWHADFHLKDYNDWSRYFAWRNGLIVQSLYTDFDAKYWSGWVFNRIAEFVASMQYGLAETLLLAIEDFLSGPSVLLDGGTSKLKVLRELREPYSDTKIVPADQAGADSNPHTEIARMPAAPNPDKIGLVRAKRIVYQYLGRAQRRPVSIPAHDARWWYVANFDNAIVTDASQKGVRVLRRDKETAARLFKRTAKLSWQLRRRADEVKQQYRDALPQLTTADAWTHLFEPDD